MADRGESTAFVVLTKSALPSPYRKLSSSIINAPTVNSSRLYRSSTHYSKPRAEALAHPAAPLVPPSLLFREQGLRGAAGDELHQLKASHQGLYLITAQAASPLGGE
ncbi:hypothetical protein QQF64_002337 [Cirrhinus molitorella]|uniref:Uncharacterized protein n=1 Tax=Cirrhinus molitorella TaxID=172907 RepID=A0ABR3MPX7_9TELE